jgi:predicted phage terminase large subunit-like protein
MATSQREAEPLSDWRGWPPEQKQLLLLRLRQKVLGDWRDLARPDQLAPAEGWTTLFLRGGRGSGKTWAGAHILVSEIESDPLRDSEGAGKWAIVAPTYGDARDKCIEGESGLLAALYTTRGEVEAGISPTVRTWNRSLGELVLHDGTEVVIDGADDGATTIQGENLRGAWCDEVGLWKQWQTAWDESIGYAVRKGRARRIATGTPKRDRPARALVKRLLADEEVVSRQLRTRDNWANLSETFKQTVARTAGTELGRQELEGEMLEEAEGAAWKREWIEFCRTQTGPEGYTNRVLALDPSDGYVESDEQAWSLCAQGTDDRVYLLESEGMRTSPFEWLKKAVMRAHKTGATIVIEKNHGGEALVELLIQAMNELGVRVPYKVIWASDGKRTRAEPVAAFYEQAYVRGEPFIYHLGEHPELEDQMCNWTGEPGEDSPDRLDAHVWAITELTADFRVLASQVSEIEI